MSTCYNPPPPTPELYRQLCQQRITTLRTLETMMDAGYEIDLHLFWPGSPHDTGFLLQGDGMSGYNEANNLLRQVIQTMTTYFQQLHDELPQQWPIPPTT